MPSPLRNLLLATALLPSCAVVTSRPNEDHCWHADGDATCRALFGSAKPYCTRDTAPCNVLVPIGCVASLPPSDECHSPCGGGQSALEDSSCFVPDDFSTPVIDFGSPVECMLDSDCDANAPYCVAESCVECLDDEHCVGLCDPEHTCVACTTHTQCPNEAGCDLSIGQCLDPDRVFHVGTDYDFPTITDAVTALELGSGTIILHDAPSDAFKPPIPIYATQAVVIRAPTENSVELISDSLIFAVEGRLFIEHLTLRGTRGFYLVAGLVHGRGIVITSSKGHAVECVRGKLHLENSMVTGAPVPTASATPLIVHEDCRIELLSTSVFSQHGPALACPSATLREGSIIRKSLLSAYDDAALDCDAEHLAVVPMAEYPEVDPGSFVDAFAGDLHLGPDADLDVLAIDDWLPGDPLVDLDGDRRTLQDHVGADVMVAP
jgi:hypothetical protein